MDCSLSLNLKHDTCIVYTAGRKTNKSLNESRRILPTDISANESFCFLQIKQIMFQQAWSSIFEYFIDVSYSRSEAKASAYEIVKMFPIKMPVIKLVKSIS